MADEFITMREGWGGQRTSTNPIAHVGLIVYNAFTAEWKDRRNNTTPKFKGPVDHAHMTVLKAEPTVAERHTRIRRHTGSIDKETTLRVFATLNGWGSAKWSKYQCLQQLRWGGFKGYRTIEDKDDMYTTNDFPVYHGGLFTTVNNGDMVIMHGDLIYWDIPGDETEAERVIAAYRLEGRLSGKRGNRRTVFLRPYRPGDATVNRDLIREVARLPFSSTASEHGYAAVKEGRGGYIRKANAGVIESLKAFGALCVIADRAGALQASSPDEAFRMIERALKRGAGANEDILGLMGLTKNREANAQGHMIMQALLRIASPSSLDDRMFDKRDESTVGKAINAIQRGSAVDKHGNLLDRLLLSVVEGNDYVLRRIIATARSSAAPGQSIDIIAIP